MKIRINLISLSLSIIVLFSCNQKKIDKQSSQIDTISKPIIENFFNEIKNGSYSNGLELLLANNPSINKEDSIAQNLRTQFREINTTSGKFIDYNLIGKKFVHDDIGVYSYIAKYENKFYRFIFVFYNNGSQVRLYRFMFDVALEYELEESLKLYTN